MTDLVIDWCSHAAAQHAVLNWHYSATMPIGKLVKVGAWERGSFIGAVLFGRGANSQLGTPYGLHQGECCELVRVALSDHESPTSQIVARAMSMLRELSPGLRLIVSFADTNQGHVGVIYQAGNWLYSGTTAADEQIRYGGRWLHRRMLHSMGFGGSTSLSALTDDQKAALPRRTIQGKHRYLMPLDRGMRRQLEPLRLPYPDG